jgi:hypothetical protein
MWKFRIFELQIVASDGMHRLQRLDKFQTDFVESASGRIMNWSRVPHGN